MYVCLCYTVIYMNIYSNMCLYKCKYNKITIFLISVLLMLMNKVLNQRIHCLKLNVIAEIHFVKRKYNTENTLSPILMYNKL